MLIVLIVFIINGFVGFELLICIEYVVLGYCFKVVVNFIFICDVFIIDFYCIMCVVGVLFGDVGVGGDIFEGYVCCEVYCVMYCGNGEDKEVKYVVLQLQIIFVDVVLILCDVQVFDVFFFLLCDIVGEIGEFIDYDDFDLKQMVEDYVFEVKFY